MASLIFLTHPEVVIDPDQPVPEWPLNAIGRARMERFAELLADRDVSAVYASTERKAMDGAAIVAERLGLSYETDEDLGENDRSSTGYIAPPEFWEVVREFFGHPHESIRGWERAIDAQTRIVNAVSRILREDETSGDIVIVSHGGVGCLLTAHLQKVEIGQESRPSASGRRLLHRHRPRLVRADAGLARHRGWVCDLSDVLHCHSGAPASPESIAPSVPVDAFRPSHRRNDMTVRACIRWPATSPSDRRKTERLHEPQPHRAAGARHRPVRGDRACGHGPAAARGALDRAALARGARHRDPARHAACEPSGRPERAGFPASASRPRPCSKSP